MKRCDTVQEAVDLAIQKLDGKVSVLSPLGIGAGNKFLNCMAAQAKRGELDLTVFAGLVLQKPQLAGGLRAKIMNPILKRAFEYYTPFDYVEDCVEASKNGMPLPDYLKFYCFFYLPGYSLNVPQAQLDYTPINFRDANESIVERGLNMVAMKASYRNGKFNCGTNVDLVTRGIEDVKKRGGQILLLETADMPYCLGGDADIPAKYIDYVVKSDEPLFNMPHQPLTVVEHAIGHNIACIIPDGATLQIGIGQMADSIAFWLKQMGRTNLNGNSEMISPAFHYLVKEGVINRKDSNKVLLTGSFIVGGNELYRFVDENPEVHMTSVHTTNLKEYITSLPKYHAVNSTLQADLFSQAASEAYFKNGRFVQYTGLGGQFEFQESAMKSEGGKSILCLRAAYRNEKGDPLMSSILPSVRNAVGVPRNKMDHVVTEYGWRCIRYATIQDRAKAMIELADSAFQKDLVRAGKKMGILPSAYAVPSEFRNNTYKSLLEKFGDTANANAYPMGMGLDLMKHATAAEKALLAAAQNGTSMLKKLKLLAALKKERDGKL